MLKHKVIGWKVSTLNPSLASLRYRAILPILGLEKLAVKSFIFNKAPSFELGKLDALVIVKSFSIEDYWLAQQARNAGVPVIFDLCDNIFIDAYTGKSSSSPADIFHLIATYLSAVIVTSEPLAEVVRDRLIKKVPIYIIPDGLESELSLTYLRKKLFVSQLAERSSLRTYIGTITKLSKKTFNSLLVGTVPGTFKKIKKALKKFLNLKYFVKLAYKYFDYWRARLTGCEPKDSRNILYLEKSRSKAVSETTTFSDSGLKTILWFGNHGAAHASFGLTDLLIIKSSLELLAAELPVKLLVVSNNYKKYQEHILPMSIPSEYVEWSVDIMEKLLPQADVVVVPNSLDEFSICKSANRTVLAIAHGVPVVATKTSALEPLDGCILFDSFTENLRKYLTDARYVESHIQMGQAKIQDLYSLSTISRLWMNVLDEVVKNEAADNNPLDVELVVAVHLPQDLALAFPLLDEAYQQGMSCCIWTCISAVKRWPELLKQFENSRYDWKVLPDELKGKAEVFSDSVVGLVSITESNLNPHRFTHSLTKLANSKGIFSATMQHGFENIGLTYSDDIHDISRILFASQRIYTWGGLELLHSDIPFATREKCLPIGCLKPIKYEGLQDLSWKGSYTFVVGVFENLHWHRYSDEYRASFLEGVSSLAKNFPEVLFLIKPHNAGRWLTVRFDGEQPLSDNIFIIDPESLEWGNITAGNILNHIDAVITSPSTVALDAARLAVPTAVVAQGLDLSNYKPLPLLEESNDWKNFISKSIDEFQCIELRKASVDYVSRVLLPSDKSTFRIINDVKHFKLNQAQEKKTCRVTY